MRILHHKIMAYKVLIRSDPESRIRTGKADPKEPDMQEARPVLSFTHCI